MAADWMREKVRRVKRNGSLNVKDEREKLRHAADRLLAEGKKPKRTVRSNKGTPSMPIPGGFQCKKCFRPMQRYTHLATWEPATDKVWNRYWDWCWSCTRTKFYKDAKVYPTRKG